MKNPTDSTKFFGGLLNKVCKVITLITLLVSSSAVNTLAQFGSQSYTNQGRPNFFNVKSALDLYGTGSLIKSIKQSKSTVCDNKSSFKTFSQSDSFLSNSLAYIAVNPFQSPNRQIIPDQTAFSMLFRIVANQALPPDPKRQSESKKPINIKGFLRDKFLIGERTCTSCPDLRQTPPEIEKDIDIFAYFAAQYQKRIEVFDRTAHEIKFPNRKKDVSPQVVERLANIQREKDAFVAEITASLFGQISQKGRLKLQSVIERDIKSKIKISSVRASAEFDNADFDAVSFSYSDNIPSKKGDGARSVQTTGGYTDYSDIWIDNSNPDNPILNAIGATEVIYMSGEDVEEVETVLSSSNGMSPISSRNIGEWFVQVHTALAWNWTAGTYNIQTSHRPSCLNCPVCGLPSQWTPGYYCPVDGSWLGNGTTMCGAANPRLTSFTTGIGISFAKFKVEMIGTATPNCNSSGCWYKRVIPCELTCPASPLVFHLSEPPYRLGPRAIARTIIMPWGCVLPGSFITDYDPLTETCVEIGFN